MITKLEMMVEALETTINMEAKVAHLVEVPLVEEKENLRTFQPTWEKVLG